ncbi:hypothetical protein [Sphingobacterium siyangense]|uniref:hypothetical protein n=1 Tax=Sphingobacterium siyangense TaxID=459529 RepID=UPI002FDB7AD2
MKQEHNTHNWSKIPIGKDASIIQTSKACDTVDAEVWYNQNYSIFVNFHLPIPAIHRVFPIVGLKPIG